MSFFSASGTVAAITAGIGAYTAMGLAYLYAPAAIQVMIIEASRSQFGYLAGTFMGYVTAPASIALMMPKVVALAAIIGSALSLLLLAILTATWNYFSTEQREEPIPVETN